MAAPLSVTDISKTLKEVGDPGVPADANREMVGKLGHRVAQYMLKYRVNEEPEAIAPRRVGVSPNNRSGADPNLQVVHQRILKSFQTDGYDPSRHLPGIVVKCSTLQAKGELVDFNLRFSSGRPDLPLSWQTVHMVGMAKERKAVEGLAHMRVHSSGRMHSAMHTLFRSAFKLFRILLGY